MKNMKLAVLAITFLVLFTTGNALAVGTANLDVTATVLASCQFNSGGALDFGNLDAIAAPAVGPVAASTDPVFQCSNGTVYTIIDDAAANPLTLGAESFAYTLNYTNNGTADGNATALGLTGDIAAGVYAGVSAGAYTATTTFTINP